MSKNTSLITLFAEDIREEKSGQVTLVGIFDDQLEVPSFPVHIPKLALLTTLSTLLDDPFDLASFRVFFKDGDTLVAQDIPPHAREDQQSAIARAKEADPDREWISLRINVEMHNLKIEQDSFLCVEVRDKEGTISSSNHLKIVKKPLSNSAPNISIS